MIWVYPEVLTWSGTRRFFVLKQKYSRDVMKGNLRLRRRNNNFREVEGLSIKDCYVDMKLHTEPCIEDVVAECEFSTG